MVSTSTTVILGMLLTLMGGLIVWAAWVNLDTFSLEMLRDVPVFRPERQTVPPSVAPPRQTTSVPQPPAGTPAFFGPAP